METTRAVNLKQGASLFSRIEPVEGGQNNMERHEDEGQCSYIGFEEK